MFLVIRERALRFARRKTYDLRGWGGKHTTYEDEEEEIRANNIERLRISLGAKEDHPRRDVCISKPLYFLLFASFCLNHGVKLKPWCHWVKLYLPPRWWDLIRDSTWLSFSLYVSAHSPLTVISMNPPRFDVSHSHVTIKWNSWIVTMGKRRCLHGLG